MRLRLALIFAWTTVSCFVVVSAVFAVSVLPALLFYRWHLELAIRPETVRLLLLAAAFIPAYALFAVVYMTLSAWSCNLLGWRPPDRADLVIAELSRPLRNWARYAIMGHLVRVLAGTFFRSTPVWVWYMRRNGARVGRHVWINSLQVGDECLLDIGDEVVIGSGVHLSGHTVERGMVRLAPIVLGSGTVVGVGSQVGIGVTTGVGTQIGALSVVPKHETLEAGRVYAGIPARPVDRRVAAEPVPEVESAEHHLRDLVEPEIPTVFLVPGIDGTAELFYRQIPVLAKRFNVVAFPLPNKRMASLDDLVSDFAQLIRETSPGPVILCGESFGGALSLSLGLQHPELVRALVIVNSFPYLDNRVQLALAPRLTRLIPWVAMPFIRRFTEHRIHSAHTLDEDLAEFRARMRGVERDGYVRRLELLRDYDIRSQLGRLTMPVLLVAGTDDRLVPSARWARYMGDRIPNATVMFLEGYGHCCLINHDLDLSVIIDDWLDL